MKTKFNSNLVPILTLIFIALALTDTLAQYTRPTTKNEWSYCVEPYLLFNNTRVTVALANLPEVTVDASNNEIFGHLKMGMMLYAEASNNKWAFGSDIIYMRLAQGVKSGLVVDNGALSAKQFAWEVSGLHQLTPWLELGVGGY